MAIPISAELCLHGKQGRIRSVEGWVTTQHWNSLFDIEGRTGVRIYLRGSASPRREVNVGLPSSEPEAEMKKTWTDIRRKGGHQMNQ